MLRPTHAVDIGMAHAIVMVYYEGEAAGVNVWHKAPNGADCVGWVAFAGRAWARSFVGDITAWDVVREHPLTLSPSILCRICKDHGFIVDGRWSLKPHA